MNRGKLKGHKRGITMAKWLIEIRGMKDLWYDKRDINRISVMQMSDNLCLFISSFTPSLQETERDLRAFSEFEDNKTFKTNVFEKIDKYITLKCQNVKYVFRRSHFPQLLGKVLEVIFDQTDYFQHHTSSLLKWLTILFARFCTFAISNLPSYFKTPRSKKWLLFSWLPKCRTAA